MIVEIYLNTDVECYGPAINGINIKMNRLDNNESIQIELVDDGEKNIIPIFEVNFEELKKSIEKLEWK